MAPFILIGARNSVLQVTRMRGEPDIGVALRIPNLHWRSGYDPGMGNLLSLGMTYFIFTYP